MYQIIFYNANDKAKRLYMYVAGNTSDRAEATELLKSQVNQEFFVAKQLPITKIKPEFIDQITDLDQRYSKKRFQ